MEETALMHKINDGFDALQIKAPKSKDAPIASTASTATEKKGKARVSSASTASGVSTKQKKPAVSKNIPPATKTKSEDVGMSEDEFTAMQASNPATALSLLLTKKCAQSQSSSEKTPSASTQFDTKVRSAVRHDSLLLKLHSDYVQKNVLESIEANP
ncbi:protein gar2-like, partial [Trifolium medium]|nr:protein gar2-like [Trifolium medium]